MAAGNGLFAFLGRSFVHIFRADRLNKSNDTYQYKCGGVKAYKKRKGLAFGSVAQKPRSTLYVATKTSCIPPNPNFLGETEFSFRIFCLEYLSRRSEKLHILILQTYSEPKLTHF